VIANIRNETLYQNINKRLLKFQAHDLADLSNAVLMERVDTKYLLPIAQLDGLLAALTAHCTVLSVDERRISYYQNSYFDSKDFQYYRAHHNGALNRYKVRCRTYADQKNSYLEVKLKNNKQRTIKHRIPVSQVNVQVLAQQRDFLQQYGITSVGQLISVQQCDYHRIAFANEKSSERLTIDFNLSFAEPDSEQQFHIENLAIIELKQNTLNRNSTLFKLLKSHQLRMCKFSKYCIGLNLLKPNNIKHNRFKETLLTMKKMSHNNAKSPSLGASHHD